jgi:hypothetical protein
VIDMVQPVAAGCGEQRTGFLTRNHKTGRHATTRRTALAALPASKFQQPVSYGRRTTAWQLVDKCDKWGWEAARFTRYSKGA